MAKKTKTDASTAAYKMAAAKLLERHRALKVALTQDLHRGRSRSRKGNRRVGADEPPT